MSIGDSGLSGAASQQGVDDAVSRHFTDVLVAGDKKIARRINGKVHGIAQLGRCCGPPVPADPSGAITSNRSHFSIPCDLKHTRIVVSRNVYVACSIHRDIANIVRPRSRERIGLENRIDHAIYGDLSNPIHVGQIYGATLINRYVRRAGEPRQSPRAAIACSSRDSVARDSGDQTGGRDFADAEVALIDKIEVSGYIQSQLIGLVELSRDGRPTVSAKARRSSTREPEDPAGTQNLVNSHADPVRDIDRAVRRHCYTKR